REFLKKRNIPETTIAQLENEKIDGTLLLCISSEELSQFIPKLGDRIAIKNFCKEIRDENKSKKGLIDRLRSRMINTKKRRQTSDSSDEENKTKNQMFEKNTKKTRQIEIGWIHQGKQVRTKLGGGTRKTDVPKTARKNDILKIGKDLFFPNNQSTKGPLDNFLVDLKDFKMNTVDSDCDVEEIYRVTKLSRLRFYFTTEFISKNSPQKACRKKCLPIVSDSSDDGMPTIRKSQPEATLTSGAYERLLNEETKQNSGLLSPTEVGVPHVTDDFYDLVPQYEDIQATLNNELQYNDSYTTEGTEDDQTKSLTVLNITLHRGQVLKELTSSFIDMQTPINDLAIVIEMIMPNGKKEAGLDVGGVFRDALSEYWSSFYDTCTNGTYYKIPTIRDDYNQYKWEAIAKIIQVGWTHVQYFPIKLAPVFMKYCIFGYEEKSELINNFFYILSESEKDVLQRALDDFKTTDYDELLEICSTLDCKRLPNESNMKEIVFDLAHKELFQKPKYIVDCWQTVMKNCLTQETLKNIYIKSEPTTKNILNILKTPADLNET
ncbi:unnamed protein product, partial [Callosobruchus maculatus]